MYFIKFIPKYVRFWCCVISFKSPLFIEGIQEGHRLLYINNMFYNLSIIIVIFRSLCCCLGFATAIIMSSMNSFISSFPLWMPFIDFSCLLTLAMTSRIKLSRGCESNILTLITILAENHKVSSHQWFFIKQTSLQPPATWTNNVSSIPEAPGNTFSI